MGLADKAGTTSVFEYAVRYPGHGPGSEDEIETPPAYVTDDDMAKEWATKIARLHDGEVVVRRVIYCRWRKAA